MSVRILQGDALTVLRTMESESVQTCVTSPPYFQLRDYGVDGQIGLEQTPAEFIAKLVAVFEEVRRVLRSDGTCWVNLGDSYAGSGKGPTGHNGIGDQEQRQGFTGNPDRFKTSTLGGGQKTNLNQPGLSPSVPGIPAKNLLLIPERFAIAMQDAGWWVRSRIAWCKKASMPESVRDRPSSAWEHVWMFTKSSRYFYDQDAVREKHSAATTDTVQRRRMIADGKFSTEDQFAGRATGQRGDVGERMFKLNEAGANIRNYWLSAVDPPTREQQWSQFWSFAEDYLGAEMMAELVDSFNESMDGAPPADYWLLSPEMFKGEHYAAFPTEIPRRCILAGSRRGDTVLDPFLGSGTTAMVADRLQRDAIGIELSPKYAEMARQRLQRDAGPMFSDQIEVVAS